MQPSASRLGDPDLNPDPETADDHSLATESVVAEPAATDPAATDPVSPAPTSLSGLSLPPLSPTPLPSVTPPASPAPTAEEPVVTTSTPPLDPAPPLPPEPQTVSSEPASVPVAASTPGAVSQVPDSAPHPTRTQTEVATPVSELSPDSRPRPRKLPSRTRVRQQRRARLALRRLDPLSVAASAVVFAAGLASAVVVAILALYAALAGLGVTGALDTLLGQLLRNAGPTSSTPPAVFTASHAVLAATAIGVAILVIIPLALTLTAFLYNIAAGVTGGIRVTLADEPRPQP